ncbi:MAG TPA: IclR family transcriptional regulator [Chloroflexia bacterium]|nr:IclR family transcriptional regulator [Chloroflexia bacterium]
MRGRPKSSESANNLKSTSQKETLNEAQSAGRQTVQSVERTFDVLEALAIARRPVAISELSQQLGLHISTVHRLLGTLIERGYARQDERSGRYLIGGRLLELAGGISEQVDLRQEAHPVLEQLAASVGETANLSVRSGNNLVYIDQVQSARLVRMFTRVGSSAPLYCTGSGKLFLAYSNNLEQDLNRYLQDTTLEPHTPATLTTPQALREELHRIRERGFSFDQEEMEEGVICVAAPIFDRGGDLVAAISVSGPISRMNTPDINRIIEPVRASAAQVSQSLGYRATA